MKSLISLEKPKNDCKHTPRSPSLFYPFLLCFHSSVDLSVSLEIFMLALKNECICRKEQKLKKEVSCFDRYSLMMKVTSAFESSIASGNVNDLMVQGRIRMFVCVWFHENVFFFFF